MTCPCSQAMPVPGSTPKATGRLRPDRATLRRELGGVAEVREAMEAKASGRPSANVAVLWSYFTKAVYKSGDLPWLATREALQNSIDACRAAVRARQIKADEGRFAVSWDAGQRALTFDDNGIGMDAATIIDKFLSIGESGKRDAVDSGEAAGGFGVAKAVILGASRSFRWEMHTRDNLAVGNGAGEEVQVYDAPARQGTRLTVFDIDPDFVRYWDRARGVYVGLEDRLRELLAANDLPTFTLLFDGAEVKPMFSRRGGARVSVEGSWGDGTTAAVKAYRRAPGDRGGAYYLRLGGLFQVKAPAQRAGLKADVIVDLSTTVRPGQRGYPFNAARDGLQDQASWTFSDLVDEVERENESVGRSEEDEFIDAEDDTDGGGQEIADQMAEAFADEDVRRAIAEAAGGIADFYGEQAKYASMEEPVASLAPRGTKAVSDGDAPQRTWVLPAGITVAAESPVEPDIEAPSDVAAAKVLRAVLTGADDAGRAAGGVRTVIVTDQVDQALRRAEAGQQLDGWQTQAVEAAIDRAAEAALAPGGGGLLQAVSVSKAHGALDALTPAWAKSMDRAEGRRVRNPFGKFAGIRISKKTYDRQRAYRFKKGYAKWVPFLLAWDGTLRLVASEARIRRTFRPGFVLDDNVVGEAVERPGGKRFVFIHPDRMAQVVKAHRERPLAVAAFLHGVAVHELTHIDGKMGDGHDEEFIARREDLGAATAHLLPAISVLVTKLLKIGERESEDTRRVAKLEKQLVAARDALATEKRRVVALEREAGPRTTPGTRVRWSTLRGWLDGWGEIERRPASSPKHAAQRAHLEVLTDGVVEAAGARELDELHALVNSGEVEPPRGRRAGHATTRLKDAIERARQRSGRSDRADRIFSVAARVMRASPPVGVDGAYVDAFLARRRGELVEIVRGAFGA
ncbi:MAG: hypothetical protein Q8P18_21860 [Pseudomonadota bacterium]|nr:hypothetical protein [Pseudomonadota bacterium]